MPSTSPIPGKSLSPNGCLLHAEPAPITDRQSAMPTDLDYVVSGTRQPVEEERIALRSVPQDMLSLNNLPHNVITEIAAYLPPRSHSNLRLTSKLLRESLIPTGDYSVKVALTARGKAAEQAISRIKFAIGIALKSGKPSPITSALAGMKLGGRPDGFTFSFRIPRSQSTQHELLGNLVHKFHGTLQTKIVDGEVSKMVHSAYSSRESMYWLGVPAVTKQADASKCLEALCQAAYKVCSDSGPEALVLASMLSASKHCFVGEEGMNQRAWDTITEPYTSLFKVGDQMLEFSKCPTIRKLVLSESPKTT